MTARSSMMRLAFVCDRWLTPSRPWAINPRTKFLETRVPLTWTGVRPYRRPSDGKLVRVLHRPEQFLSPGFLRQLRRLPGAKGHPANDGSVVIDNARELVVGWAGSPIEIEEIGGYKCPVGDGVVCDLATMRAIEAGDRETSLGYMPLWCSPPDDEKTVDPNTGAPCGVWQGPFGPEYYDLEHVVDPDCDLVRGLVAKGFDADTLGPNHLAFALRAGRGGEQSRLQRAADDGEEIMLMAARDGIDIDPENPAPLAVPAHDATWVSNPSRDMPVVEGEWDGDAAAASVFTWAGFDGDSPKPEQARQAFLAYDSDTPELRGSYKLPIARYRDGRLEIVSGGLQAAASYLPQTEIPEDVRKRARDVLDFYFAKLHEQQGRSSAPASDRADLTARTVLPAQRTPKMTDTTKIQTRFASPALVAMAKGLGVELRPFTVVAARDEIDPEDALMFLEGVEKMCAAMREKMGAMEVEAEDMKADKKALEEAVAAKERELVTAKEALAAAGDAMKKACDEVATARDEAIKERDALRIEVAPLRQAELARLREQVVKLGVAKDAADKIDDATELKRAGILARVPESARSVMQAAAADAIETTWSVVSVMASAPAATPASPGTAPMPAIRQPATPTPARDSAGPLTGGAALRAGHARLTGNFNADN